jgi:hypothetical protein
MENCFKCKAKIGFCNPTIECENCAKSIGCSKCISDDSYHSSNAYCPTCKKEAIEEDKEDEYDDTTYITNIKCANCNYERNYAIKKGVTLKEYLANIANKKCENCGCNMLD